MPDVSTDVDKLEQIYCKIDDFQWCIKCFASSHFNEFDSEHISAAMNCFSTILDNIKQDVGGLINKIYKNKL